jgi:uncharacterized protein
MFTQNKNQKLETSQNSANNVVRSNPLFDLLRLAIRPQNVSSNSSTVLWIKRHPILAVVSLAYAFSWIGLLPLIRDPSIATKADLSHVNNPAVLVYVFIGVLGCLWAAMIVAGAVGGAAGRYNLLRGYLKWNVGIQWYLVVLFSPVLVLAAAIGWDFLQTGTLPIIPVQNFLPSALISSYAFLMIRYMFGNFEEICWRASVLPRLQAKHSALVSSLIVGVIQGLWHLPYVFVGGHYIQVVGLPAIIVQSIAMGVVVTWIYNNTRGSLLLVALFHAAYDALSQFQGSDVKLIYMSISVWCFAAILLLAGFGSRTLSRKPDSEIAYAIISSEE